MKSSARKWGNSLAIRIPKPFAEALGLGNGASVDMTLEGGTIVLRPDPGKAWDLATLLAGVTDENIHSEWETEAQEDGPGESDR